MKFRGIRKYAVLGSVALAMTLASCGGGQQEVPFAPIRVLAFGDENSVIDSAGRKYTINALNATSSALDCVANPIWVQSVATAYGHTFPECNPNSVATASRILATPAAKVADFAAQVDAFINGGGTFAARDLVTVMVGQNDVFEQYALFPATPLVTLQGAVRVRGQALAAQINRIAALNGRVVVGKLQDLAFTPFAATEAAANPVGENRIAVIRALTQSFNDGFLSALRNDGKHIGLFDPDQNITAIIANPGLAGLSNVTVAACAATAALPNCSSATLISGATTTSHLWADSQHMTPPGHLQLSQLAFSRANGNPF
jgi:outer membrane lipase/esterase